MKFNFELRSLLISMFALVLLTAMTKSASACDCRTPAEKVSFERADLVFEGKVVRVTQSGSRAVYTFAVNKTLKVPMASEFIITGSGTNCDASFNLNSSYRVYARRFEDKLTSGQCSGNRQLKKTRSSSP